jgi:16S rRNA (adenine1518-N6/adenine1519-N6)-dimethyltransferase
MEIHDVVDRDNVVTGRASRKEVYEKRLNHRGEMLLQLRGRDVSFMPHHWVTSAGGHVIAGETYEQAAARELKEELGVSGNLEFFCRDPYTYDGGDGRSIKFIEVFRTVIESGFVPNTREVERAEFFSMDEIRRMIARGEKFHPELSYILKKHFGFQ